MATHQPITIYLEQPPDGYPGRQPVRLGIPLPRGLAFAPCHGVLDDGSDRPIPCQTKPLGFWPDRSIKWLLVDFFTSLAPGQKTSLALNLAEQSPGDIHGIEVSEERWRFVIDTGNAVYTLPKQVFNPFASVRIGATELIDGERSSITLRKRSGMIYYPFVDRFAIEEQGPLRTTLCATGKLASARGNSGLIFKGRITFFSNMAAVRIEFLVRNPQAAIHPGGMWDLGDTGSILFEDISLNIAPSLGDVQVEWYANHPGERQTIYGSAWSLYQDSSGGENWNSANHVDSAENSTVSFRGYRINLGTQGAMLAEGTRAQPVVKLNTAAGWLAASLENFWQNFPKALRVEDNRLDIGVFPGECGSKFELQGGEQKRHVINLEFGMSKSLSSLHAWNVPIHAYLDPVWIEKTQAVAYFTPRKDDPNQIYLDYVDAIIDGPHRFQAKRENIDEYGWRNYGDLYADHEAVGHSGSGAIVSHYNNQYDFIHGAFIHYLRSGDRRWWRLLEETAKHTIDIDIYHTSLDKPAYNGGMFWHTDHYRPARTSTHRTYSGKNYTGKNHGGGPDNEHNYTSGLLAYFYLTGDLEAAESIFGLADWVIAMDDGTYGLPGLIDESPTGQASKTVDRSYHKPGRGAANSINALVDAYQLSNDRRYLTKADELIQRCIHPNDAIADLKLDEPEYRWSYLVFLQILGKYLGVKTELREIDYEYFYARDSLLHYAAWMAMHELPYKEVLHKVLMPTETWSAHDIRKCQIFNFAAYYGPVYQRALYQEKADFFFARSLNDILSFNTAFLTRPMVIMAGHGYIQAYFHKNLQKDLPYTIHRHDFGVPGYFLVKEQRIAGTIRNKLRSAAGDIKRLSRLKWQELSNGRFKS